MNVETERTAETLNQAHRPRATARAGDTGFMYQVGLNYPVYDIPIPDPSPGSQTIRIYKRRGKIGATGDDVATVAFGDDGNMFRPVHTPSGWIGLRQMGHTEHSEYGEPRIFPLLERST